MDLMIIILVLLAAFVINAVINSAINQKRQRQLETIQYLNSIIHKVSVEKYHGIEYWFDEDTNKFLAQGKNYEEISETLKIRFPNHVFLFDEGGFSEKTNWKFIPFDNNNASTFISSLIYGRAQ